ncbi:MAG: glutaredoxin family protein [Halobacteriota archaeon]
MTLRLYQLDGCPYCERVVEVLEDLGLEYESVWVEAPHSKRDEVKRVSGQRTVPVLVDEDRDVIMAESEHIVDYLETNYGATADVPSP